MAAATGTKPKLYFDTCCFLDMLQYGLNISPKPDRAGHVDFCRRFLDAARKGEVAIYTSLLTATECVCVKDESDTKNPKRILNDDVKSLINGMLQSGRSGVMPVQPTPSIVNRARDLEWVNAAQFTPLDSLHIATALAMGCNYFITTDGKLDKKGGVQIVKGMGMGFCRADEIAHLLPDGAQYLMSLVGGSVTPASPPSAATTQEAQSASKPSAPDASIAG